MPWEKAPVLLSGLKGRENLCQDRPHFGPATLSRPFRPPYNLFSSLPRASACGLSPGLCSLGPLGRFVRRFKFVSRLKRLEVVAPPVTGVHGRDRSSGMTE
jgi:hypothetical protein